jgi:hypothetical protein
VAAETGMALRHLLSLREKAIRLEAPQYIREAESLLNRCHPDWRKYVEEPKKTEPREPVQELLQPLDMVGFDYIAQANAEDPWLDRR